MPINLSPGRICLWATFGGNKLWLWVGMECEEIEEREKGRRKEWKWVTERERLREKWPVSAGHSSSGQNGRVVFFRWPAKTSCGKQGLGDIKIFSEPLLLFNWLLLLLNSIVNIAFLFCHIYNQRIPNLYTICFFSFSLLAQCGLVVYCIFSQSVSISTLCGLEIRWGHWRLALLQSQKSRVWYL